MMRKPRAPGSPPLRILHLHSSFDAGGQAAPCVQLINAFGRACMHGIVSAQPGALDAAQGIDGGIAVDPAVAYPALHGRPTPRRLQRLAGAMLGHDLVLTYGYGAIDAVMAHTVFGGYLPLPPLVHHEDGTGAQGSVSNWYRRIALGRASALVVPSRQIAALAVEVWHQPQLRVKQIPAGIRTGAFAARPRRDALPRLIKREGELWLGTWADGARAHELTGLVRAFGTLPDAWQLVILGECPAREAIRDEALRRDLGHRVHLPGGGAELAQALGLFDLFVLASERRPSAVRLMEAMAAGLAVAAMNFGDSAIIVSPENRPYLAQPGDEAGFVAALQGLAGAPAVRASVGSANRLLARTAYDEAAMVAAYRGVYGAALGRGGFP